MRKWYFLQHVLFAAVDDSGSKAYLTQTWGKMSTTAGSVLIVLALCLGACGGEYLPVPESIDTSGVPPIPRVLAERIGVYQRHRDSWFNGWRAGGGLYISTRFDETTQIHRVRSPGAQRSQLTFYNEPIASCVAIPDRSHPGFVFGRDSGGTEQFNLYCYSEADGSVRKLTRGGRNEGVVFSNRGDRFAYCGTARNGADFDIYISTVNDTSGGERVLARGGAWYCLDWSPDDTKLLVLQYVSASENHLYILDLVSRELREIFTEKRPCAVGAALWSHDGKGIYCTSDREAEFLLLRRVDSRTGKESLLIGGQKWDVEEMALSEDRRTLAVTLNEDGLDRLYVTQTGRIALRRIGGIPDGQINAIDFSPDGGQLAFVLDRPVLPRDVYTVLLKTNSIERWVYSETGELPVAKLVGPRLIHYPTFDSVGGTPRMISAFVYTPKRHNKRKHPVLIRIHGGPESQATPTFSGEIQYLTIEAGLAVVIPNVRGSSGYGRTFLDLDNGLGRLDAVGDIGALLDWIGQQPDLDSAKVALYGGSYGGFMVLASAARYSSRIACAVSRVGITNFITFLSGTSAYRRDLRRAEYGDERDSTMHAFLRTISPVNNAASIRAPLLVAQGANDPRVPAGEARQIVEKVRKNNVPVWYIVGKDEGHDFKKKRNRDYFESAVSAFLQRWLGSGSAR